jgi:hypothetical protein
MSAVFAIVEEKKYYEKISQSTDHDQKQKTR